MNRKLQLFLTAVLLFVLSWLDVLFFGTTKYRTFPAIVNQLVHFAVLFVAGIAGYSYFKPGWIKSLWGKIYMLMFAVLLIASAMLSTLQPPHTVLWKRSIGELRQIFAGPLPLLIFYLFERLADRRADIR